MDYLSRVCLRRNPQSMRSKCDLTKVHKLMNILRFVHSQYAPDSLSDLLADARREGYAVPYAESWNLESLEAVVDAAEQSHSPIIAGFNGGFLRHSGREKPENLSYYTCFCQALNTAKVPVAFILNESDDLAQIRAAIELGFNAVMPENEGLEVEEYRQTGESRGAHRQAAWGLGRGADWTIACRTRRPQWKRHHDRS